MKELCSRGAHLRKQAAAADHVFKSRLIDFFSRATRSEAQRQQLELLGADQREADEAFHRHCKLCAICAESSFHLPSKTKNISST